MPTSVPAIRTLLDRFQRNRSGFPSAYRWWITAFLLALLADASSTVYFMHARPKDDELHPAVGFVARALGPVIGPFVGFVAKAIAGLLVAIYCRRWARIILGTAAVLSFWAAWYNVWGVELYYPRLLRWIPW